MPSNLNGLSTRGCALALLLACSALAPLHAQSTDAADIAAQPGDVDYQYSPFNPVPADQMRGFVTDQLGKAHNPLTVDAGHVQIEANLLDQSFDRNEQTTLRQWSTPNATLKYGLSDGIELDVIAPSETSFEYHNRASKKLVKGRGLSDVWVGAKLNLFGDDPHDGPAYQSLALIPMIKIPSGSGVLGHSQLEASVAIPYRIDLPGQWALTLENVDGLRQSSLTPVYHGSLRTGYHGDYAGTVNISHPLYFSNLTAAVEYSYDIAVEPNPAHTHTVDVALQWELRKGLALTVGDHIGLNAQAPAENPYIGIATRF